MMDVRLLRQLDLVAARYRALWFRSLLAAGWAAAAAVGVALWLSGSAAFGPLPLLTTLAVGWLGAAVYLAARTARDPAWIARRVEAAFPELRSCLLAAVEQRPELPNGRFGYLQGRVIHEALDHSRRHDWPQLVSNGQMAVATAANVLAFLLFAASFAALALNLAPPTASGASSAADVFAGPLTVIVEPGDTEVERRAGLSIVARVQGPLPAAATLLVQSSSGDELRLPMTSGLSDPLFSARIPVVDDALTYHVELGGIETPQYRVNVFDYPRLERADARLKYPDYTQLPERIVQDVRTVSVVEGTRLTLQCFLNKPVTAAVLTDVRNTDAQPIVLSIKSDDPKCVETTLVCVESRRLALDLTDDAGRKPQKPVQFSINVLPNQPPNVKPTFPAKDLEVSPLEEIDLKATVWDDFGVAKLGLTYTLGGGEPVDVSFAENIGAKEKRKVAQVVSLEDLKAEADQLLSYHWWAEDIGPDGKPRRVMGDMYFAEMRPFEEIFRQGEQPPGGEQQSRQQQQQQQGQSQNAQDAQELAKLQKDIVSAIWKVIRRETRAELTEDFATDVEQIKQSQASALEQASGLSERVQDERSQQHLEAVLQSMQSAAKELTSAAGRPAKEPLRPALAAAQAAYQALLKLRAREHEIVRQQQNQRSSQPQQQSSARSQQQREQLQQLNLQNEENRYEAERTARERREESAADRENRQAQNRLRELARRQGDVNERLKELQSALQEATPDKQAELRRQLKRLEDEQRQILQDTDELQSRLEEPQNAERMTEQRQQLEETRDQVRRASEALEENKVSQAAAAGTRAEQQFEDLREEFRRRAANRFQDEMQELRRDARTLEDDEKKIAERLKEQPKPQEGTPTLREPEPMRDDVAEDLARQRQRLGDLQERMKNTIGEAESAEPILSQRLYEAVRDVQDRKVDEALQQTERAVRQGAERQAQEREAAAGEGLQRLRAAVDRAAEGVLGDETEALRRARDELQNLAREVDQEIQRNNGNPSPDSPSEQKGSPTGGQRPAESNSEPPAGPQAGRRPGKAQGNPMPPDSEPMNQPGGRQPGGQQPGGDNEPRGQGGRTPMGEQPGPAQQPGQQPAGERGGRQPQRLGEPNGEPQAGAGEGRGQQRMTAPLGGQDFRQFSDRLRDVEEMIDDPDLRAEAARIRERARSMRAENKRHSEDPNWDLVQQQVAGPLLELRNRVAEELLKRTTKKALVPLDRDPVPPEFSESTRRYYERLGAGK